MLRVVPVVPCICICTDPNIDSAILDCNAYVFQDGVEIDLADKNGKTPLMLAVGRKHDAIVSYLKKEAKFRTSVLPRIDFWLGQFTVARHVYYCTAQ